MDIWIYYSQVWVQRNCCTYLFWVDGGFASADSMFGNIYNINLSILINFLLSISKNKGLIVVKVQVIVQPTMEIGEQLFSEAQINSFNCFLNTTQIEYHYLECHDIVGQPIRVTRHEKQGTWVPIYLRRIRNSLPVKLPSQKS